MTGRRFRIAAGSHAGARLPADVLRAQGWTETGGVDWDLYWDLAQPDAQVYHLLAQGRWLNHYWGIGALNAKHRLADALAAARHVLEPRGLAGLLSFAPETYVLPRDYARWRAAAAWDGERVWISKPHASSRGRGVSLVTDVEAVRPTAPVIVQRYIDRPHLIDGYKYTLRCYVLLTSLDPLVVYLSDAGFVKLASRPYSRKPEARADRFRHLTNPEVLSRDHTVPVSSRNMTHEAFRTRLRASGIDDDQLWAGIRRAVATTVSAARDAILAPMTNASVADCGMFELLGFDVLIDEDLQPWVIECNMTPSLRVEADAATEASRDELAVKTRVVGDTLALTGVLEGLPLPVVGDEAGVAARLDAQAARRGAFTRVVPSADSLPSLPLLASGRFDIAAHVHACHGSDVRVTPHHAALVDAGGEAALFSQFTARLEALNLTASFAWLSLSEGAPVPTVAADLATATEADIEPIERDLWRLVTTWIARSLLTVAGTPAAALPQMPGRLPPPSARRGWNRERLYRVGEFRAAVHYPSADVEAMLHPLLAVFESPGTSIIDGTFTVLWHAGAIVTPDGRTVCGANRHALATALHHELQVARALARQAILATRVTLGVDPEGRTWVLAGSRWPRPWLDRLEAEGWRLERETPVFVGGAPVALERRDAPGAPIDVGAIVIPQLGTPPSTEAVSAIDALVALMDAGDAGLSLLTLQTASPLLSWVQSQRRLRSRTGTPEDMRAALTEG